MLKLLVNIKNSIIWREGGGRVPLYATQKYIKQKKAVFQETLRFSTYHNYIFNVTDRKNCLLIFLMNNNIYFSLHFSWSEKQMLWFIRCMFTVEWDVCLQSNTVESKIFGNLTASYQPRSWKTVKLLNVYRIIL